MRVKFEGQMIDPVTDLQFETWIDDLIAWDNGQPQTTTQETISYGDHPEQVIDVWRPKDRPARGTVIAVHGGYFLGEYGRNLQDPLVRVLAAQGFITCNVEYRRHERGGSFHETTTDIWNAVTFLAKYMDTRSCAVFGHSAGGYLSQWVANHPNIAKAILLGPVLDLGSTVESGLDDGAVTRWMQASPAESPDLYALSDLTKRLPTNAPSVLIHGDADGVADVSQSRNFQRQAKALGQDCALIEIADGQHFAFMDPRQPAFELLIRELNRWAEEDPV